MKRNRLISPAAGWFVALVLGAGLELIARADDPLGTFYRAGRWEIYGSGQSLGSNDINYDTPDGALNVNLNPTGLGGVGFGYYFTDNLALRFDMMFGPAEYEFAETGISQAIQRDAFISTGRLNVDYLFFKKRLTPFVTGGIGYQYISVEYSDLGSVPVCYWDPWWGYICTYDTPTYWETDFSWNAGAGVVWNVTDRFFMRIKGDASWLQYEDAEALTTQWEFTFSIGVTY
jgi:opacity protein-like surface antigen